MIRLDSSARQLGLLLNLGDLNHARPCMGYQNACVCPECLERAKHKPQEQAAQPWDVKAA